MFRRRLIGSIVEGIDGRRASHDVIRFDSQNSIDVINFNYTIIFDNLFYGTGNIDDRWFDFNVEGKQCEFSIGSVNHVHGTLMSGNTLFGVSSPEQIVDENARKLSEKTGMLIKSNLDKERNGFLYRGAEGSLENSEVVVAFGTSFGGSDKFWWNKLAELIIRKPEFRLYIFPYSPRPQAITNTVDRALLQSEWRGKFLSSISDEMDRGTYSKLVANMYKIEVLSCGPFMRLATGEKLLGDPLDLNYFAKKLNTFNL